MTRKRFKKLMMAQGMSRNKAEEFVAACRFAKEPDRFLSPTECKKSWGKS